MLRSIGTTASPVQGNAAVRVGLGAVIVGGVQVQIAWVLTSGKKLNIRSIVIRDIFKEPCRFIQVNTSNGQFVRSDKMIMRKN